MQALRWHGDVRRLEEKSTERRLEKMQRRGGKGHDFRSLLYVLT